MFSFFIVSFVLLAFILFYNRIFTVTFDEDFAKASGVKTGLYNIIISALCSLTVVIGMKVMGTLLITSLIVFPCLSARQIFKTYAIDEFSLNAYLARKNLKDRFREFLMSNSLEDKIND